MLNGSEFATLKVKDFTCFYVPPGKHNLAAKLQKDLVTIPLHVTEREKYFFAYKTQGYFARLKAIRQIFEAEFKEATEKYDRIDEKANQ